MKETAMQLTAISRSFAMMALSAAFAAFSGAAMAADQCGTCHKDISEANHSAAHKNVACDTCHTDLDKHVAGTVKRPGTNNDPAVCGTCHKDQFDSLYKMNPHREARKSKSAAEGPAPNPFFNMAMGGHGFTSEHDEPRSHNFMLMDQMLVDRGWAGRFQPKEGWLYAAAESGAIKAWDMVKDVWPEDNVQKARPTYPGTMAAGNAICWTCKTTDPMLGWAYLGDPKPGTTFSRTGSPIDVMRASNHSLNCNFCHDPHTAKPRIVRDALIAAVTRTDFPSVYNEGKNWAKVDVKDAGLRGFTRKVGYLDRSDSKLFCAQCHVEYVCNPGINTKTGGKVGFDSQLTNLFPFVTTDNIQQFYDHVGYGDFKHPLTGAVLIKMQHPDTETYNNSVHDKAGVGCDGCHMPKTKGKNGKVYTNHWATSPRNYMEETCLTCHKDKTAKQMNYVIDTMHNRYTGRLRNAEQRMMEMFNAFEIAKAAGVSESVLEEARKLHQVAHVNWEWNTATNGAWFHNPELAQKQLDAAAKAAIKARDLLRKAAAEKNAPAAAKTVAAKK